jgi:Fe-S cluster assembly iron-binding protein IscA
MIAVTERAKEQLESMLISKVDNSQAALRLINTDEGEYGLHIDVETPDDKVVNYEGRKVLVIDKELADNLEGTILDTEITSEGIELAIFQKDQK